MPSKKTTTTTDKRYQHFDANRNCHEHNNYVCTVCISTKGVPVRGKDGKWWHLKEDDQGRADEMLKEAFQVEGGGGWDAVKGVLKDFWGLLKKPGKVREDTRAH